MVALAPEQLALVRLMQHGHDYVAEWRHLFQGAMIRATTAKGRHATVTRDGLDELVTSGIMVPGYGGSFALTETGKLL